MLKLLSCTVILLFILTGVNAQNHCLQFSKKEKKTVFIKEGRNISFVFKGSEEWGKAKIVKITADSIFFEQPISKADILKERESNYNIIPYDIKSFRMMAYNNTPKAVGKGSAAVVIFSLAVLTGGASFATSSSNNETNRAENKFFKKNVNFERGWKAEIVLCE